MKFSQVQIQKKQKLLIFLFGFTILFGMVELFNAFSLYYMLPAMFIIVFFKHPAIFKEKYVFIYGLLVFWMLLSMIYALDYETARSVILVEVACLPCSVITYYLSQNSKNHVSVYVILILYLIEMLLYLIFTEGAAVATSNNERKSSSLVNANTLGYFSFYATFAYFLVSRIRSVDRKRTLLGMVIIAFISLYIALITASRQILIIQFPFIFILVAFLFKDAVKKNKSVIVRLAFVMAILIPLFLSLYEGSFLAERAKGDITEDNRYELILLAIAIGCQNPIFGVGPGNFAQFNEWNAFSHCTYTELFACCGFPALILFLIIIVIFTSSQISRYRKFKDEMYLYFFIFSLFFILDNFFFVFTDCLPLMEFFFFFLGHSECYYREHHKYLCNKKPILV